VPLGWGTSNRQLSRLMFTNLAPVPPHSHLERTRHCFSSFVEASHAGLASVAFQIPTQNKARDRSEPATLAPAAGHQNSITSCGVFYLTMAASPGYPQP
jgi:hypothetical protein